MTSPEKFGQATNAKIESERVKWRAKRIAAHLSFVKLLSFHTSSTFMDYLHGDVNGDEAWLACLYEYAREAKSLRNAAERRDKLKKDGLSTGKAVSRAVDELEKQPLFLTEIMTVLECESFPKKDWQELEQKDRSNILRFHSTKKILPLGMTDARTLKAAGILEKFSEMAETSKPVIEDHDPQSGKIARPYKPMPPLLQQHESFFHAIFDFDFSESETQLVIRFKEWLRLPENQERLVKYKWVKTGTTGKALDRLKDLAAWRLYREHGHDVNFANKFAAKHRKKFTRGEILKRFKTKVQRDKFPSGSNKPFRDAKGQGGNAANEADLFGEDADARKVQASAWKYMVEIMPKEFAPPGPHLFAILAEVGKRASKGKAKRMDRKNSSLSP